MDSKIGSLSNVNDDGEENVNGDVQLPNFTLQGGLEHKTTIFYFFPTIWKPFLRIQLQEKPQHLTN